MAQRLKNAPVRRWLWSEAAGNNSVYCINIVRIGYVLAVYRGTPVHWQCSRKRSGVFSGIIWLRARPKAERVFAEYENFRKLSDRPTDRPTTDDRPTDRPTDRDAFQRLISFEPSYRLTNGFRHLKATFNKSFVLA